MSALKEAFELIEGFPKHESSPRFSKDVIVEYTFTDENFNLAIQTLGKLKQLKTSKRELWGYWQFLNNGSDKRLFVVVVTKQKIKKEIR